MKNEFTPSPTGQDVMLKITDDRFDEEIHRIVFTHPELHELEWAIRKYLEGQPSRNLREATGK